MVKINKYKLENQAELWAKRCNINGNTMLKLHKIILESGNNELIEKAKEVRKKHFQNKSKIGDNFFE